jgi:hypothetical protein
MIFRLELAAAGPAKAGNYTLTYGKQFEVCRAFAENLASFGDLPEGLFEWPLNPKFKKLRKPDWKPLDPKQHLALIENWVRTLRHAYGNQPPGSDVVETAWKTKLANIHEGRARLERAVIDVNNDGKPDLLYRLQFPNITDPQKPGWNYFISDDDGSHIENKSDGFPMKLLILFFMKAVSLLLTGRGRKSRAP